MIPTIITTALLVASTALIPSKMVYAKESASISQIEQKLTPTERIDALARYYELDIKLINRIIACESSFKPEAKNVNTNGTTDHSYFQINSIHRENASHMGYDIEDPEDNIEFGMYLMKTEGTKPWRSSFSCWGKELDYVGN